MRTQNKNESWVLSLKNWVTHWIYDLFLVYSWVWVWFHTYDSNSFLFKLLCTQFLWCRCEHQTRKSKLLEKKNKNQLRWGLSKAFRMLIIASASLTFLELLWVLFYCVNGLLLTYLRREISLLVFSSFFWNYFFFPSRGSS